MSGEAPYLQLDFDAKRQAAMASNALGLDHPGRVLWGLSDLWEHVFRTKDDTVSEIVLAACFGSDPRAPEVLEAFGFLERLDGGWRVRGAKKRLFGQRESGSRGGKKTAASGKSLRNLRQFQPPATEGSTEGSPKAPSVGHRRLTEAHPASSIQHPEESEAVAGKPAPPPLKLEVQKPGPKPRKQSLQERFAATAAEARKAWMGEQWIPDVTWPIQRVNKQLGFLTEANAPTVAEAYDAFLADERKGALDPPWPLWAFAADWSTYASRVLRGTGS